MTAALCVTGIILFWLWSSLGRRAYRAHAAGRLFERRQAAARPPFALLLILAPLAHRAPNAVLIAAMGVAAALVYVWYVALDPMRVGFWHHRRIRPIGVAAAMVFGVLVALYAPTPACAPLAFAALVFNRYLRLTMQLTEQQFADNEAQRQKLIGFDARLTATAFESADDKVAKAG